MSSVSEKWTRPNSVSFPVVWSRFTGLKTLEDGKLPVFRIQDVTKDMHEDILDFMVEFHLHKEIGSVLMKNLKIYADPVAVKEFRERWAKALKYDISVVAFLEGAEENGKPVIAGCNVHGISYRASPETPDMYESPKMQILIRDLSYVSKQSKIYDKYAVDKYVSALGLCVHPRFRGQGLGKEILKSRFEVGMSVGLECTFTTFSGYHAQKLGRDVGMEFLCEVPYDHFKESDGSPVYPGIECKSLIAMGKRMYIKPQ